MDERSRGNKQEPFELVKRILWLGDFPPNQVMVKELECVFGCKVDIAVESSGMSPVYAAALLDNNRYDEIVVVSNQAETLMPFIAFGLKLLCPDIIPSSDTEKANIVIPFPCGPRSMKFTNFKVPLGTDNGDIQYVNIPPSHNDRN